MKAIGIKLALGAALVLIFLGSTRPSHADEVGAVLTVCNHGTVPVELVAAIRIDNIFGDVWQFSGSTMAPQDCIAVNNHHGTPSYIAFGFTDSKGEWGSGSIAEVQLPRRNGVGRRHRKRVLGRPHREARLDPGRPHEKARLHRQQDAAKTRLSRSPQGCLSGSICKPACSGSGCC